MAALIGIANLTRRFGGVIAVDAFSLSVNDGELVSIIGPNGAGKTTLFNLVTGLDKPDGGTVTFDGRDITRLSAEDLAPLGFARTFQHGRVFGNLSVLDNVLIGAHTRLAAVRPHLPLIGPVAELALALIRPSSVKAEEEKLRADALDIIALFGERLTPRINNPAFSLSYANRRRLEIARALSLKPRVLFLDEPTAGMNPSETKEMLEIIRTLKGKFTILLIEHKLDLVMQLSDRVVVMDDGKKIAEGPAREVAADPAVIAAYLGSREVGASKEVAAAQEGSAAQGAAV
jgi:branched-chain amino acid transport system ATP-binding protein